MEKKIVFLGDSITAWNKYPEVENYGVPGYFSRDVLWLLEENENIKGDIAVLMIGINDILGNVSSEKIFQNIVKILDILGRRFKRVIAVSVLPTVYIDKNKKIRNLNFFLREQLFTEKLMIDNLFLNSMGVMDNKYSSDGVHLSPAGYQILNKKLKGIIEE